jgi:8-oxo-dGTP diphosphatase
MKKLMRVISSLENGKEVSDLVNILLSETFSSFWRSNLHRKGTWALPGGHLEFGESFAECASRELEEETGLQLSPERMRYLTTVNTVFEDKGKKFHYVTILVGCGLFEGEEPELREPDKCEGWHWIDWDDVKEWAQGEYLNDDFIGDLFVPLQRLAETAIREDSFDPFDPYEAWKAAEEKATILEDEER